MPPAQKLLGTMPEAMQFDTWSDTPNQQKQADPRTWREDGSHIRILKSMAERQKACKRVAEKAGQQPVLANASFKPNGGLHRHHYLVPASSQQWQSLSQQFPV
jgi:hypothetical protein